MATTRRVKGSPPTSGRVSTPSARYTPPTPVESKVSARWVPFVMVTLLIAGVVIVMTGYFGFQPGGAQIISLLVGASFIAAGCVALIRYR